MDETLLRLLVVEDSEEDALLLTRHLRREGFAMETLRVDNAEAMRTALGNKNYDAVLSDHNMPQFDSFGALETLHASGRDIPFVVVSASIGEEMAVELMRRGAHDFVMKGNTTRLGPVIKRELREAQHRRERREALESLRQRNAELETLNRRLRSLIDSSKAIAASPDTCTLGKTTLRQFADLMAAEGGSLFIREESELVLVHSLDAEHQPDRIPFPLRPDSVFGRVWREETAIVMQDITKSEELARSGWDGYQNGSVLALPLRSTNGEMLGIVALHNKADRPFAHQDREIGTILASLFCETRRAVMARETLRQSEESFRALTENSHDIIMRFDSQYRHLYVNPAMEWTTGLDAASLLGKTHEEIGFPEDLCKTFEAAIRQVFEKAELNNIEFQLPTGAWMDWLLMPEYDSDGNVDAVITSARDISRRRLLEADQQRLTAAIEQAAEIFIITDAQGLIEYVNPAFSEVTGYPREEALGKNPNLLKSGNHDAAFYDEMWQTIKNGNTWRGKLINKKKDGTLFVETATISPVRDRSGAIVHYVGVKNDITREEFLESQLRQSQKMEAVGQLAGGIAHDFNNLLQAILGYIAIALMNMDNRTKCEDDLKEASRAAQRAAVITRQLLAFSRRQVLQITSLDLTEVVNDLVKMIQRLIGEGIELTVVPDTAPATVLADRGQLEQILMNLCVNARDAMPDGGSLFIETQRVVCNELDCQMYENLKPGPYVLLTVRDTGCGMTHETMKQIFEPFFTTKGVGKGTGLGLATIYGIVQQNGAAISVTSEIDKGTVFRIWWPFSEQVASSPERIFAERAKGGKESILLAEDDDQVRKLARRILEAGGYRVLEAPNGEEALQIFKEHADEIRLLVFDVVMPAKGGRIAFEEIRAIKPSIKCLFASGYSEAAVHTNFILKEGLHLLEKPYEFNDLLRAVRKVLEG